MGFFYSVRGWLEGGEEHLLRAKRLIAENVDQNPHVGSWHFPVSGGGFSRFIFFGHTVRDASLPEVRAQVARLAAEVQSPDGDDVDFLTGIFHVTAEDNSKNLIWRCGDGQFLESDAHG